MDDTYEKHVCFCGPCAAKVTQLTAELDLQKQLHAATKHSVIATVGGTDYEGHPTSSINFLQRLRILVEKEKQLESQK